jgi:N-acetylmuramoyl-L-alanine amidase
MARAVQVVGSLIAAVAGVPVALAGPAAIQGMSLSATGDQTSLVIALSAESRYRLFSLPAPERVVIDFESTRLAAAALPLPSGSGAVRQVRVANRLDGSVRIVLDLVAQVEPRGSMRDASDSGGSQFVVDLVATPTAAGRAAAATAATPSNQTRPPLRQAAKPVDQMAARPAGRDIVVAVDAGHGGKDPGAHGPRGVLEKDVTLRIARRLADAINAEPGMRGVLTRNQDEFIPLRRRMERARAAQADLFVSIHADAVRNRAVRGASVYVLNEKGATDEAARRLADRENAADLIGGVSLGSRDRTLASVLLDLSQNASLSSSIDVADEILDEMARVGAVRRTQVMQAPFMVLKSPDVPSVLIETAYISNPAEERRLDSNEYREQLANAILTGMRNYFYKNPPAGTLVAELSRQRLADTVQHVIRSGESLSMLAARYNTSVQRIRVANGLTDDRVAVGQVLHIPVIHET